MRRLRMLRTTPHTEVSSYACYRQVLRGGSGGDVMFSVLMVNRRWCGSGQRQAVCDVCFPVSSPEVSGFRDVGSRLKQDGTDGLKDDVCTPVETQDL